MMANLDPNGADRPLPHARRRAMVVAMVALVALAGILPATPARQWLRQLLHEGKQTMVLGWQHLKAWRHAGMAVATLAPVATSAAPPAPPPPMRLAINVSPPVWWNHEASFANLAVSSWGVQRNGVWMNPLPDIFTSDGAVTSMAQGDFASRILLGAVTGAKGADIRCTFDGRGTLDSGGSAREPVSGRNELRFHWTNTWDQDVALINVRAVEPGSTIGNLDCRKTTTPRDAIYETSFIDAMKPYHVIRFKDWQQIDNNPHVTWARRHKPGAIEITGADGVPIEQMIELSRATGADPWFNMPWHADADYVRNFAQLVHDTLPRDRKVYVELSNEVWNWAYPVTHDASREGLAEHLTADGGKAVLLRYAEKSIEVMKIWEGVFADSPGRLVRVVATQHVLPSSAETVLGYPGLAAHVDALATAPYFDAKPDPAADPGLAIFFRDLNANVDATIDLAVADRAVASRFGKRFIAYEAGQSVIIPDIALNKRIQRDPRMEDTYRHYLSAWRTRVGDVIALYHTASPIDNSGAWGLIEHTEQPLSETPKLRAVLEAAH